VASAGRARLLMEQPGHDSPSNASSELNEPNVHSVYWICTPYWICRILSPRGNTCSNNPAQRTLNLCTLSSKLMYIKISRSLSGLSGPLSIMGPG
jgi:hypothetical protein